MQNTTPQTDLLEKGCHQLGLNLTTTQHKQLQDYLANLITWNQAYNLTAIRDPEEMVIKHLLDSLAIQPFLKGNHALDVGTGPGLPGIPLAIVNPDMEWTLLDSNGKKTRFLLQMKSALGLKNVRITKARVEALTKNVQYDVITSRAFASLQQFVSACLPLLAESGRLLAMKGRIPDAEMTELDTGFLAIETLPVTVPYLQDARHLIVITEQPAACSHPEETNRG